MESLHLHNIKNEFLRIVETRSERDAMRLLCVADYLNRSQIRDGLLAVLVDASAPDPRLGEFTSEWVQCAMCLKNMRVKDLQKHTCTACGHPGLKPVDPPLDAVQKSTQTPSESVSHATSTVDTKTTPIVAEKAPSASANGKSETSTPMEKRVGAALTEIVAKHRAKRNTNIDPETPDSENSSETPVVPHVGKPQTATASKSNSRRGRKSKADVQASEPAAQPEPVTDSTDEHPYEAIRPDPIGPMPDGSVDYYSCFLTCDDEHCGSDSMIIRVRPSHAYENPAAKHKASYVCLKCHRRGVEELTSAEVRIVLEGNANPTIPAGKHVDYAELIKENPVFEAAWKKAQGIVEPKEPDPIEPVEAKTTSYLPETESDLSNVETTEETKAIVDDVLSEPMAPPIEFEEMYKAALSIVQDWEPARIVEEYQALTHTQAQDNPSPEDLKKMSEVLANGLCGKAPTSENSDDSSSEDVEL